MKHYLTLSLLAAAFAAQLSIAAPLWTTSNAGSTALYATAYGQSLYVAVGAGGALYTSANGNSWTAASYAGTPNSLMAVAYGNGTFVAVGENGWTVTSTDGVHWTSASSGATAQDLSGVVYAAGKFVAVGDSGAIITSSTGSGWTAAQYAATVPDKTDNLAAVTYGNGHFIAVGVDPNTVYVSANGTLWTETGGPNDWEHMLGATYGNGLFAITGQEGIYTSPDGTNWTTQVLCALSIYCITYGNGLFVAAGWDGGIYLSTGGTNVWTTIESDTPYPIYGITYNGSSGLFVTAGEVGTSLSSTLAGAASLPPKMNWLPARYAPGTPDTAVDLTSVATGGSVSSFHGFVAVGNNPITAYVSTNGIQWTEGGTGLDNGDPLAGVAFFNSRYVAVGGQGHIYSSVFGTNWNTVATTGAALTGVGAYGGDGFAVGYDGALFLCTNWPSWKALSSGVTENLYAVASGMKGLGESVAVGGMGRAISSGDLFRTWTNRVSGTLLSLYGVGYGNGRYVAVGELGLILTSANGIDWTPASTNHNCPDVDLYGVAYGNGQFVVVGDMGWTVTSRDGLNWTWGTSPTLNALTAIAYNNGTFAAVGSGGTMIISAAPVFEAAKLLPNRSVQVGVSGGPGQHIQILISTDLQNWSVYTTVNLDNNGLGQFADSSVLSYSRRFFRAVVL